MGLCSCICNFLAWKFGTSTRNDRRYQRSRLAFERSSTRPSPSSLVNVTSTPSNAQVKYPVTRSTSRVNQHERPCSNSSFIRENTGKLSSASSTTRSTTGSTPTATKRPLADRTLKTQASIPAVQSHPPVLGHSIYHERYTGNSSFIRENTGKLTSASSTTRSTTGSTPTATKRALADRTLKTQASIPAVQSHPPQLAHSIYHERHTHVNFKVVNSSILQPLQHRYSVSDLTFKLESLPKDRSFTPHSNTVYHNQWTTCNAIVYMDERTNQVNQTTCKVEISSQSPIQFRNIQLLNGRLQFSMKASDAGNDATIIFTINKLSTITKDVYVIYNPPSSVLSEMTIRELGNDSNYCNTREGKFTLRVSIIDVFGDPALRNSEKNCLFKAIVSEAEDNVRGVEIEKRICPEDHLHFDLSVSVRPSESWSKKLQIFLNEKEIAPAQRFEVPDKEQITLLKWRSDALEKNEYKSIPDCLLFDNSRVFIPIPTDVEERKFLPYDDERCQIQALPGGCNKLVCKNTAKHVILGADCAHINNIKRVLQLKEHLEIQERSTEASIIFDHGNVSFHQLRTCKDVLVHLLRGSYYRDKASEAARARMEWKRRVEEFHKPDLNTTVRLCKFFKDHFGDLMNKYNREACEELFSFFNYNRDDSEVDLHGLHVADEERLELLRLDILRKNLSDEDIERTIQNCRLRPKSMKKDLMAGRLTAHEVNEFIGSGEVHHDNTELETLRSDLLRRCDRAKDVDELIEGWRSESDEAIRKLRETLEKFDLANAVENNSPWIEIIVGAGHHSKKKKKQNIRPKVEKFLKEKGNQFAPVNKGSLVVTFIEYSGPEPCFGEYYCVKCDRCWKSSKSYTGKYQECSRCHFKCWPVKQREKEIIFNYRREGKEERRKSKPHQSSLCQKCQELGYPCNEDDN